MTTWQFQCPQEDCGTTQFERTALEHSTDMHQIWLGVNDRYQAGEDNVWAEYIETGPWKCSLGHLVEDDNLTDELDAFWSDHV